MQGGAPIMVKGTPDKGAMEGQADSSVQGTPEKEMIVSPSPKVHA